MKKILITGATGFIGREVGKELVRKGYELFVLSRNIKQAKASLPFPAHFIHWNADYSFKHSVLEEIDAVIHLAGESVAKGRWSKEKKESIYNSRIQSTQALAQAIQAFNHIKVAVFASAIGFYGDRANELLSEESTAGKGFLAQVCQDWEQASENLHPSTRRVVLRIGAVLGRGGMLQEIFPLFQNGLGGTLGGGKQYLSWIHIQDLVSIVLQSLNDKRYEGTINATSPTTVTNKEFTKVMSEVVGAPALMSAPRLALALSLGEKSEIVLSSQNVAPKILQKNNFPFSYTHLEEALVDVWDREPKDQELYFEQYLHKKPEEVFQFFQDPYNLDQITPPFLKFKTLSLSSPQIKEGTLIKHALKIHGLPIQWKSLIRQWNPPHYFMDIQLKGPYKKWEHVHQFEQMGTGTLVTDRVLYQIPLSILGKITGALFIKKDIESIFKYRQQTLSKIFNSD